MSSIEPANQDNRHAQAHGLMARTVALNIIREVRHNRRSLDNAIAASNAYSKLQARDRDFVKHLLTSVLRHHGQIDALINSCLDRPLPRRAILVRDILRLGVTQLVILGTPAHAAVDTAVRLCVQFRHPGQKGLVNAVMRRLSREGPDRLKLQDGPRLNTPDWLWKSWESTYGKNICRQIATAHMHQPPLDLSVKADPEKWAKQLGGSVLGCQTVRLAPSGDITALPGFRDGAWWVQDLAAALPAQLLLNTKNKLPTNGPIIDLCAAPGGKTAQLAATGAHVIAVDHAPQRVKRLRQNLKRLSLKADIFTTDAIKWRPPATARAVLVDAPCSATGTIRRHPDIVLNKSESEIIKLSEIQERLLLAAADMLSPDACLIYSVCSLQPEEGVEIIEKVLSQRQNLVRMPFNSAETKLPIKIVTTQGDIQTMPSQMSESGGLDGFYIARLVRKI